ncbi:MAG: hypothetical protein QG637_452 [Chloroflexota bacterium]|nr:hypothetical protein [Chloroflexota bacterium]
MVSPTHIARVVARCRAFYAATEPGHFLIHAHVPTDAPEIPPLNEFDLDRQLAEWLDYLLAAARPRWAAKTGLDDDTLPSICPRFGIAEHSAWLGTDVRLQETTCLPTPMLETPADLARLTLSPETRWYRIMRDSYAYLHDRNDGSFFVSVRGTMSPMDIGNAIRGDELFSDFLADPAFAHRLMAFLTSAMRWYYDQILEWSDDVAGGRIFMYHSSWMGPRTIGHMTNDAAMLCGPRIYDAFGFPYESQLTAGYAGALYHVHNQKLHFAPRVAQLPNLTLLEVTNDPKTPPAFADLPRVLAATGAANLMLYGTSDQVRERLGELKSRNVFLDVTCRDRADAEDIVAFVRAHSKPLG